MELQQSYDTNKITSYEAKNARKNTKANKIYTSLKTNQNIINKNMKCETLYYHMILIFSHPNKRHPNKRKIRIIKIYISAKVLNNQSNFQLIQIHKQMIVFNHLLNHQSTSLSIPISSTHILHNF
jgi:hypothetical protein